MSRWGTPKLRGLGRSRVHGDFYVPVPDLKRAEWGHVLVRARTSGDIRSLTLTFNLDDPRLPDAEQAGIFQFAGDRVPVIHDGSVQTYRLRADYSGSQFGEWKAHGRNSASWSMPTSRAASTSSRSL